MFKVPPGQDPYSSIGQYIQDHVSAIEDIVATIEIDGVATNELFMVDVNADGYFAWKSDWYEGGENVVLMDFFPVSEAQRPSEQDEDVINRRAAVDAAIEAADDWDGGYNITRANMIENAIKALPSARSETTHHPQGKWLKIKPIGGDLEAYMCPYCRTGDWNILADSYKFCPYCGKYVSGIFDAEGD